jgi:2-polyprenyl-3-methyl-5-hydroxy-6-metoxy-1,4-benzoquinol methylase/streptomycin 6-kinase
MILDPVFSCLSQVLNCDAVLDALQTGLAENADNPKLAEVKIFDVRYKPNQKCLVLYQLTFKDKYSRRSTKQLFSGQLLRDGEQPSPPPEDLIQRYVSCASKMIGSPFIFLPALNMVGYMFPLDPQIPWLFDVLDPLTVKQELDHVLNDQGIGVDKVETEFIGYTPQTRATVRYNVCSSDRGNEQVPPLLVGKTSAQKNPVCLFGAARALWQAAGGQLRLARPVCCLPSLRLVLQEHVEGQRLGGLAGSPAFADITRNAARAIANMHGLTPDLTSQRTHQTDVRVLNRWTEVLCSVRPELANRIVRFRNRLLPAIEEYSCLTGPVHGDFHHTNVLADADDVILIDIDELAFGDQMVDVGRFMASLRIPSLRVYGNTYGLAEAGEAFFTEYAEHACVDERRVRLFEASSLLTSAGSAFRIQRPRWAEEVEILLDEAERVFQMATHSPSHPASQPINASTAKPQIVSPRHEYEQVGLPIKGSTQKIKNMCAAIARRCRGTVLILGSDIESVNSAIRERGLHVVELDGLHIRETVNETEEIYNTQAIIDAVDSHNEPFDTVVLNEVIHKVSSADILNVLAKLWDIVRPGGRLIVTVPNRVVLPRELRDGQFNRRDLSRLLRALGRPNVSTDQPLHWLTMYVDKKKPVREVINYTNRNRLRVISRLCRGEVIELGCGKGHLSKAIRDRARQVIGVDMNAKSIQRAKRLYRQIPFICSDIRNLTFPAASFDTAVLSEVLEHVSDTTGEEILAKAWDLIRPGGRMVVSVPNEDSIHHPNHVRQFNARSLKAMLKQYGNPKLVADQPYKWLVAYVDHR